MVDLKYVGLEPKKLWRRGLSSMVVSKSAENIERYLSENKKPDMLLAENGDIVRGLNIAEADALKNMGPVCQWVEVESKKKRKVEDEAT